MGLPLEFHGSELCVPGELRSGHVRPVYIHTVIPTGVDSCVFQCMMLTPEEPATEKAERHYQKNYDVVRVVFDEDFAIGEGIQQGLATGANQHFTFGRYECGLHLGQRSIDAALAGELRL